VGLDRRTRRNPGNERQPTDVNCEGPTSECVDIGTGSTTEPRVRCEQAEDRKQVFAWATEPRPPTEPMPNSAGDGRPDPAAGPCGSTGCPHRDRAETELRDEGGGQVV
jgi:hypothetical protein